MVVSGLQLAAGIFLAPWPVSEFSSHDSLVIRFEVPVRHDAQGGGHQVFAARCLVTN